MKGVKKPKMVFSETGADEHIRVKFKRKTNELPNKEATEYKAPVELLEGLTRLTYQIKRRLNIKPLLSFWKGSQGCSMSLKRIFSMNSKEK